MVSIVILLFTTANNMKMKVPLSKYVKVYEAN